MKRSFSSATLWAFLLVVFLSPAPWMVRPSDASQSSEATAAATFHTVGEHRQRHSHRSLPHHNTGAYSGSVRRPAPRCPHCRLHPPPPPPFEEGGEIDPRYGVDKRLVPTGPNPLHN